MSTFAIGQRWISEPEPELGLGTIMETGEGRVQVLTPPPARCECTRRKTRRCAE